MLPIYIIVFSMLHIISVLYNAAYYDYCAYHYAQYCAYYYFVLFNAACYYYCYAYYCASYAE